MLYGASGQLVGIGSSFPSARAFARTYIWLEVVPAASMALATISQLRTSVDMISFIKTRTPSPRKDSDGDWENRPSTEQTKTGCTGYALVSIAKIGCGQQVKRSWRLNWWQHCSWLLHTGDLREPKLSRWHIDQRCPWLCSCVRASRCSADWIWSPGARQECLLRRNSRCEEQPALAWRLFYTTISAFSSFQADVPIGIIPESTFGRVRWAGEHLLWQRRWPGQMSPAL